MTFNLPDYHVIDAIDLPLGGRRVIVKADTIAGGCPDCGGSRRGCMRGVGNGSRTSRTPAVWRCWW
ncbi:hypothetical protein [Propioniciclava sp. MC1683]|uniref:hypothetical protein n=1 Tax=Propioniciclava sp. MC1683 TaxID=2760309 RepID=UPI0021041E05|nr:hypothetical protein [Propioniciclava sp. MC1683]